MDGRRKEKEQEPVIEKNEKKKKRHPFLKALGIFLLIFLLAGVSFVIYCVMKAPDISVLDARPQNYRSTVLDDSGNVVLTLSGESSNRVYVSLDQVPDDLEHAFIAVEDSRFYEHHGIDLYGIARAFVKGVTTGDFSQGASTITQQLLKNNVFTDWTDEQTFLDKLERKIQEQYLAIRLENTVDKSWILENYLNTINLGGGNWGVETAAKYYFGKDVSELDLAECACLAAITKNPTAYNPLKNPEKNAERRLIVLKDMLDQGYITVDEYNAAGAEDVYSEIQSVGGASDSTQITDYFQDALIYELIDDLESSTGCTEAEAWNKIYKGGLTIYSTESSLIQQTADSVINDDEYYINDAQSSMVIIDNETGAVKALIGGRGEKTASLIYNRATTETRQPGSTIKVIGEYAAALDAGDITLATTFDDAPYTYSDGTAVVNSDGLYKGETTVRDAIAESRNMVALKVFQQAGIDSVWNMLKKFGIDTLTDSDKVEALALGGTSGGVTNLEMTAAYSALSRGGAYIKPYYYTKVVDHDGNTILEHDADETRVVKESTAKLLTSAMESVMTDGTGTDAAFSGQELAGKSGTTSNVTDAWFIGFSSYYTCGVWGGYDDRSSQESSSYTHSLWRAVMEQIHSPLGESTLDDADNMDSAKICIKSGKLAVDGVCDDTLQGDMTRTEYFASGTEPTEDCDIHEKVSICKESGQIATQYCPSTEDRVYLKQGTDGTEDEAYVMPTDLGTCTLHTKPTHWWDNLFGGGSTDSTAENSSSQSKKSGTADNTEKSADNGTTYNDNETNKNDNDENTNGKEGKTEDNTTNNTGNWWNWLN